MNPLIPAIVSSVLNTATDAQAPAAAQPQAVLRTLPDAARKAVMAPPADGYALFDGASLHLAPGLQIRDTANRIVLPATLQRAVPVRYLVDARGDVSRIWILTAAEAEAR